METAGGAAYPPPVRIHRPTLLAPILLVVLTLSAGCGDGVTSAAPAQAAPGTDADPEVSAPPKRVPQEKRGVPLPAYQGNQIDGSPLSFSDLIGKRFLLFGFNPEVAGARATAEALAAIADSRGEQNFEIVGVAAGTGIDPVRAFLDDTGLEIPTLFDGDARINNLLRPRFGLRSALWLLHVDAAGNVVGGTTQIPPNAEGIDHRIQEMLRLPTGDRAAELLADKPLAPLFKAQPMAGGEPIELADYAGKPVIVMFFLHTCEHCHSALKAMRPVLEAMPEDARPTLLGISIVNQPGSVLPLLKRDGLDFFTVLSDASGAIQKAYGAVRGVPVIIGVDAERRMQWRVDGWRDDLDPPLMKMRLNRLANQPVPMLLRKDGFSGNEFCAVCHESEAVTWEFTNHAGAYDTLARHGADHDGECVSCHVVGYGESGGFSIAKPQASLEGVGCENCHGSGGPHRSPDFVVENNYEGVCTTCHNPTHSLGFEYATFLPQISHAANLALADLPADELALLLAERREIRDVLPRDADYVGSPACLTCHAGEHATWSEHPHAQALATLETKGEANNADCLKCHTTGYGEATGFPEGGASDHPGLAGVGCESCHGPGANHIAEDAPKRGTILSLGDKCDSCVILQICGSCHDDANDPGFEFVVQDKIDHQRHGTIEAGTGLPLSATGLDSGTKAALLEHAFAHAPEGASR